MGDTLHVSLTMEEFGKLHVYAQHRWHDSAYIAGDTKGLQALRDAIDQALAQGCGEASVMPSDGETYRLHVFKVPDETLNKMYLPYTSFEPDWNEKDLPVQLHPMCLVPEDQDD